MSPFLQKPKLLYPIIDKFVLNQANFVLIIFLLFNFPTNAQLTVEGVVLSKNDSKPIPYANIQDKTRFIGIQSDSTGRFKLTSKYKNLRLTASSVGYEPETMTLDGDNFIVFRLAPSSDLKELTVKPGENPAETILRKVWQNSEKNKPENIEKFKSENYSKYKLDLENAFVTVKDTVKGPKSSNLILLENIGKIYQKNHRRKEIVEKSISTYPRQFPLDLAVNPDISPFSFYNKDFQLNLNNLTASGGLSDLNNIRYYLNPLYPGYFNIYNLEITDTLLLGRDSLYVIEFWSRKNGNQNALKGSISIIQHDWAIVDFTATNADTSQIVGFSIKHHYQKIKDSWIPQARNFDLKYHMVSKQLTGTFHLVQDFILYGLSLDFDPNEVQFDGTTRQVMPKADTISKENFEKLRPIDLTLLENNAYLVSKKKLEKPFLKNFFVPALKLATPFIQGVIPVRKIDILTGQSLVNQHEYIRPAIGFQNSMIHNPRLKIFGSLGYGISDKSFKYNLNTTFHFTRDRYNKIELYYAKDLQRPGQNPVLLPNILYPLPVNLNLGTGKYWMDEYRKVGAGLFFKPLNYTQIRFFQEFESRIPLNYTVGDGNIKRYENYISGVSVRFAFKEKINRIGFMETQINQNFPVFRFNFSFYQPYNSENEHFTKSNFHIIQQFKTKRIGKSYLNLSAGYSTGILPFPFLFNNLATPLNLFSSGNTDGFSGLALTETSYNEYISTGWIHDFENKLLKTNSKWFRPQFAIGQKVAWTHLYQKEISVDNQSITGLKSVIFESKIGVKNLFVFKLFGIRIGLGANIAGTYFGEKNTRVIYRALPQFNWVPF